MQTIHANLKVQGEATSSGYRFDFDEGAYEAWLTNLRLNARGEWQGDLSISGPLGRIYWGRIELASGSKRVEVARIFRKRTGDNRYDIEFALELALEWATRQLAARMQQFDWQYGKGKPPTYLLHPFLPDRAVSILFGDGGSGKGYMSLLLALTVASGRELVSGYAPREAAPVVILDYESNEDDFFWRLDLLARGFGLHEVEMQTIRYVRMDSLYTDAHEHVLTIVRELNAGLVILDSLAPACGSNAEGSNMAIDVMRQLRALNSAVLVIAHVSKASMESKNPAPYGSVFVRNLARNAWAQRKVSETDDSMIVCLQHTKHNIGRMHGTRFIEFQFGAESVRAQVATPRTRPELVDAVSLSERITLTLTRPMTVNELAEQLSEKPAVVRARLNELIRAGKVAIVDGTGHYKDPHKYALVDPFAGEGDPFE